MKILPRIHIRYLYQKQEGYYPTISDTDVTLSADGTSLNGSYSEKGSREITVVYKVKQLQYTVKHAFEKADGTEYTVDDSLTETFSGDYGELTEAESSCSGWFYTGRDC